MACGVHLGILLICLVQAEHARCLWVKQAPSSQRRNSDRYVGFSQQDSNVQSLGYLQNKFRQPPDSTGSTRNSSSNTQAVDNSGFTLGLSTSDSTQAFSQPAPDGYATYGLLQSSSGSEADGPLPSWRRVKGQKVPQAQLLDRLTPISSGSFINHFSGEKKTRQIQQDARPPNEHLYGNGVSVQSSPREKYAFTSHSQPPAQRPYGSAAETPACGPRGSSSKPFRADASTEAQPLACGLGRRVSSERHYGSFKRSPQDERPRKDPIQRTLHQGHGFPSQGSSKPPSNCVSYPPDWPNRQSADPNKRGQLSSASTRRCSGQVPWTNANPGQGVQNLLVPGSSRRAESSARRFVATRTFNIPEHLGGHSIRRLKGPPDQQETSIQKPQQPASYKPQGHKVRWYRVKLLR